MSEELEPKELEANQEAETTHEEFEFSGKVTKVKRGKPYPITRPSGSVWECKIRIQFLEVEEDGEEDAYIYKAYPTQFSQCVECCKIKRGTPVTVRVKRVEGALRGEIIWLKRDEKPVKVKVAIKKKKRVKVKVRRGR